jgi:murein DD-endopeptidase MepM/ murein hydrolase activator NlpD
LRVAGVALFATMAGGGSALASSGGTAYVPTPTIKSVKCAAGCMSHGRVRDGGKVRLRGSRLSGVTRVVFSGARGPRDDVAVKVRGRSDRTLTVPVPFTAQSGRLVAYAGSVHAWSPKPLAIMPPPAPQPNPHLSPAPGPTQAGAPRLETATSRSLFALDQAGGVTFSYRFSGGAPSKLTVKLVRVDSGRAIKTWSPAAPSAGEVGQVSWNGMAGRAPAPSSRYAFRLEASSGSAAARSASAHDVKRDAFDLRPALFPIRGRHSYSMNAGRFGARRSGHTHQGQDVMAACGTPLVAARGGVVKANKYHSAAGNYIVIDGDHTGIDYGYMHLRTRSPLRVGDRVHTGDRIGVVGQTGDATACHLHFEEWSSPGWYSGGHPFDPLADLKSWDSYS